MRIALLAAALLLAGCETQQELQTYYMAQHPMQVCYKAITSPRDDIRQAAGTVLMQRGIDCNPYMPAIAARANASQAQLNTGLMLMQAGRAQPAPSSGLQANCRSYDRGTYTQTVCD